MGASPQKLALIGILAVILVGVLYFQFAGSSDDERTEAVRTARADRLPRRAIEGGKGDGKLSGGDGKSPEFLLESVDRRQWKSPALDEIVRYDPFALPAAFPQPAVAMPPGVKGSDVVVAADTETDVEAQAQAIAGVQAKLAELQQRGVRVIIQGKKQATAVIGDRTVRVGDDVDGFTVKAIQADGVVVERKLE
jgi:hypothetical protein